MFQELVFSALNKPIGTLPCGPYPIGILVGLRACILDPCFTSPRLEPWSGC